MPNANNSSELKNNGHVQVSIKTQSNNEAAVNTDYSPDRTVIYIQANYSYLVDEGNGNWRLDLPYKCFKNGRPGLGTTYTVQVRFGDNPLWSGAGSGIENSNFLGFAAWRAEQVSSVPSKFGEWSNVQTVFVYGAASVDLRYNLNDFVPEIVFSYAPTLDDPIQQVSLSYQYLELTGEVRKTLTFSGQYVEDNNYVLRAKLPIAPIYPIHVVAEAVTNNYSFWDAELFIPSVAPPSGVLPVEGGIMISPEDHEDVSKHLQMEELNDGIIAKDLTAPASPSASYNIYRINIWTVETVKIAEGLILEPTKAARFKDFTVEMGAEYQYVVCGCDTTGKVISTLISPFPYGSKVNGGYGRLMHMPASYLTTKNHQLRLQGNVTLSALKRNTSDSFQTTIGSEFPFHQRQAKINYRTFTVGAVVSINFDPTATFMRLDPDDGLWWDSPNGSSLDIFNDDLYGEIEFSLSRQRRRDLTSGNEFLHQFVDTDAGLERETLMELPIQRGPKTVYDEHLNRNHYLDYSSELTDNMVYFERKFRERVMEWLSDGKPKLFRSETEGNMIVAITAPTFTPLQNTNRMVYSFSCTATEIAAYNLENLLLYDLVPVEIRSYYMPESEYEFNPGGFDPNIVTGLFYRYNRIYDIPNMKVGVAITPINTYPAVMNGKKPYRFYSTTLPAGLSIDIDTGIISGAPSTENLFSTQAVLRVIDATGDNATMTINVGAITTALDFAEIPERIVSRVTGEAINSFSVYDKVSGGLAPYYFYGINLPSGITVNYATGVIEGSFAFAVNAGAAYIQAVDSLGNVAMQIVYYENSVTPLKLTHSNAYNLDYTEVGRPIVPYTVEPAASGGYLPYTFSAEGLPSGISISSTGVISGTPDVFSDDTGTATIKVTDTNPEGAKTASMVITFKQVLRTFEFLVPGFAIPEGAVSGTEIPIGTEIAPLDIAAEVSGGLPPYTYNVQGIYPFRINSQGVISGRANVAQEEKIAKVMVTDSRNPGAVTIEADIFVSTIVGELRFPNNAAYGLPDCVVNNETSVPYSCQINLSTITGGTPPYSFTISGFPSGVTIDPDTGLISGTPTSIQAPSLGTVIVSDSSAVVQQASITIPIGGVYAKLNWSGLALISVPDYQTNRSIIPVPISGISGGKPPYSFDNGSMVALQILPSANVTNPNSAHIEGTTGAVMPAYTATVEVIDALGQRAPKTIPIGEVYGAMALTTLNSMATYILMKNVSQINDSGGTPIGNPIKILQAVGGTPPFEYYSTGGDELFPGVFLNDDGEISGSPTSTLSTQNISMLFRAEDSVNRVISTNQSWFTPQIYEAPHRWDRNDANPTISIGHLPLNTYYRGIKYIECDTQLNPVYTSTPLPPGLSLVDGALEGSPTSPDTNIDITITCTVNSLNEYTPTFAYSVHVRIDSISGDMSISNLFGVEVPFVESTRPMSAITIANAVTGGVAPYVWTISNQPLGMNLVASNEGRDISIEGTPTTPTPQGQLTLSVTDAAGKNLSIMILFKGVVAPLIFTHSPTFDIPAQTANQIITNFSVAGAVTGGTGAYRFFATNLTPYEITEAGVVGGASGTLSQSAKIATLIVEDTNTALRTTCDIQVGAITGVINFVKVPADHDIPAGQVDTIITPRDLSTGVTGGEGTKTYGTLSTMPTWLALDTATGIITGTRPSVATPAGNFTVQITDTSGNTSVVIEYGETTV